MNYKPCVLILSIACLLSSLESTATEPKKVGFLFSHGLADDKSQAYNYSKEYSRAGVNYINDRYIMQEPIITFNYPDAQGRLATLTRIDFRKTDLGQKNDIKSLDKAYRAAEQQYDEIVAVGLSRGASALINWAPLEQRPKIKALVLESPFHSFIGLIHDKFHKSWIQTLLTVAVQHGIPFFKYTINGPHPIDMISKLPKDLPILLICSDQDTTVPAQSTVKLARKLTLSGHKNIYLLRLKNGSHAHILSGPDGHTYQIITHAFFKRFNLPHNDLLATEGIAHLDACAI